ncbi:MAG TPA: caspase family protein [Blastocatellia bacterium]|nr:caspase family protein [Blastocatellia bacterium]
MKISRVKISYVRAVTDRKPVLLAVFSLLLIATIIVLAAPQPKPVVTFLLELPDFSVAPTSQSELVIPSPQATNILIHILKPQADLIDYGQIYTFINGEAASQVSAITSSENGKLIRMTLDGRLGLKLVPGRNCIEVRAQNQRGRLLYGSFVVKTSTENRNDSLIYQVKLGNDPKQQTPPELVLLEPESAVEISARRRAQPVRISGVATAASTIERVNINGQPISIKRGEEVNLRKLGLTNEDKRVTFDTTYTPASDAKQIVVEAVDSAGNRTQLQIPLVTTSPGQVTEFHGHKYALIIGISKFRNNDNGVPNLKYADADAVAVSKFLQSPSGGRFPPENILLLVNEDATLLKVREAFAHFTEQAGPDDLLLIFFASHGSPDPLAMQNLYFIVNDTQIDRMSDTGLSMRDLQNFIQEHVRSKRMVLLVDTCHSAGLTGSPTEGMRALGNNLVNLYSERLLYQQEGKAVITSSDVNEYSQEAQRWGGGHGVFTHFLLEGMSGKADANGDHLVTLGELFRYVRQHVRLDTQFKQNPRMLIGTNDDLAISTVAGR